MFPVAFGAKTVAVSHQTLHRQPRQLLHTMQVLERIREGVKGTLFKKAPQTQLDAVINHMLGVQILYRQFVAADVPAAARARAAELGWT